MQNKVAPEMDVVGHDDVGVKCEVFAIVFERGEKEFGVRGDLEETTALVVAAVTKYMPGCAVRLDRHAEL